MFILPQCPHYGPYCSGPELGVVLCCGFFILSETHWQQLLDCIVSAKFGIFFAEQFLLWFFCEVLSDLVEEHSQVWANVFCAWQQKELWLTKLGLGYFPLSFPAHRDITLQECSSLELVKNINFFFNSENPDCAIKRAGLYYVNMEGDRLLDSSPPCPLLPLPFSFFVCSEQL